jgi:acetyl esterase/lipase
MVAALTRFVAASLALAVVASVGAQAQAPAAAQPAMDFSKMFRPIPADDVPGAIPLRPPLRKAAPEQWEMMAFGGDQIRNIRNVVNPTLTPVLPDPAKATGVAVIVAPGGGFRGLSIDSEGFQVARWLAERGIAAFVLKYRLIETPREAASYMQSVMAAMKGLDPEKAFRDPTPEALEDALAAVRLVRQRSAEWKIAPGKVGLVGFSAGAITALGAGLAADPAARPDFIAPIYPVMAARQVPADAPPMFLAISLDDPLFAQGKPLSLIQSWRDAKRPLEVHLYEKGGHGFGMSGRTAGPAMWTDQFHAWMKDRKILPAK